MPLIQAAVSGESLLAQVRCLSNLHPQGPCLTCGYNPVQWSLHDEQTRLSCSGGQIGRRAATRSAAFLCTLAGTLAVNQMVRRALSLGRPVDDELVSFCGYTNRIMLSPLRRNLDCRNDHAPWIRQIVHGRLADRSITELLEAAAVPAELRSQASVALARHTFIHRGVCESCGRDQPLHRFVADEGPRPTSVCCRAPLAVPGFFARREIPATALPPNLPLSRCGAEAADEISVSDGTRRYLLLSKTTDGSGT